MYLPFCQQMSTAHTCHDCLAVRDHLLHCFHPDVILCAPVIIFLCIEIDTHQAGRNAMDHQILVGCFVHEFVPICSHHISTSAWFFFKLLNVSGAEAVVASASPWIGQGESACLVKPYVDLMTPSEIHLTMTSGPSMFCHYKPRVQRLSSSLGFSTISGSVLAAYINLGVPAQNLVTSSVMSIPASIAISKMRMPEVDEPVTRGRIVVDRGDQKDGGPANALHAFSQGALFGLIVAGQILWVIPCLEYSHLLTRLVQD